MKPLMRHQFISLMLIWAIVALCPLFSFQARCSPFTDKTLEALDKVKAAQNRLQVLPVHALEMKVSFRATSSILRMKEALERLAVAYLESISADSIPDVKKIQNDLNNLLGLQSKRLPRTTTLQDSGPNIYGREARFEVRTTSDERRLLQIKSTFSIQCGEDSILLIFEPNNGAWKEIFNWQARLYREVSGALNNLQYEISPSDSDGKWYVLGADNPAHCASCWGGQKYYVLRPIENSTRPIIQFRNWDILYECDKGTKLDARTSDFYVYFQGRGIEVENLIRPHVNHYELENGKFIRIQPIAQTVRDFVDEWITLSWQEASKWCLKKDCQEHKMAHEMLQEIDKKRCGLKFGTIRQDYYGHNLVQVELRDSNAPETDPSWHFLIKQNRDNFKVMRLKRGGQQ